LRGGSASIGFNFIRRTLGQLDLTTVGLRDWSIGSGKALMHKCQSSSMLFSRE
jgi:hypothetical protein